MLELFEKLQKYHPKFKDVDFENHDILFYLFFDLNQKSVLQILDILYNL